jgi:hypothetical protein
MCLDVPSFSHSHHQVDFDRFFFPFLKFMALHMTMSYRPQATQMNEITAPKIILGFDTNPTPS